MSVARSCSSDVAQSRSSTPAIEVAEVLRSCLVLGAQIAEQRMDPVRLEVHAESIQEHETRDISSR